MSDKVTSTEEVLRKRAQALSRTEADEAAAGVPLTLFSRAGERFALRVEEVAGGGTLKQLSTVPGAPRWIAGAVFHRGEVLTLIDLPLLWGQELIGIADMSTYLIATDGKSRVGLLVEDLGGVQEVRGDITPWRGLKRLGVSAVCTHHEEPILILSAEALLRDPQLAG